MKKLVLLTFILIIIFSGCNKPLPDLIENVISSVVYVEVQGEYEKWSGSGVIVSSDGLILTASHVVEDATEITVTIGEKEYEAIDFYASDVTDCGVVLIDANDLPYSRLGDSDKLKQGDSVFLIGSPYGLELYNTVTLGIVSGLGRDISFFGDKLILQSDAASNFGNSGGPLFSMDGEVVGVLVGRIWGADGVSLVIPSNICQAVLNIYKAEKELELMN